MHSPVCVLAILQRKSPYAFYTVEGHGQMTQFGYRAWSIDPNVQVFDEPAGVDKFDATSTFPHRDGI